MLITGLSILIMDPLMDPWSGKVAARLALAAPYSIFHIPAYH
jgi:hypothetical protein